MRKPASEWNEEFILSLPREDDSFERKPSALLDLTLAGANKEKILDELACQLSAFANTGGGTIVYGLRDSGEIDQGGVSHVVRGNQTGKEWLENVIPGLTESKIVGVNVYEILPVGEASQIHTGKSLVLVSVPDSDRAPHQSTRDKRYYVRLGSHSIPARHKLIEDIRNRAKHPSFAVSVDTTLFNLKVSHSPASLFGELRLKLSILLKNTSPIMASNICFAVHDPTANVSFPQEEWTGAEIRETSKPNSLYLEIQKPIYPDFEVDLSIRCTVPVEIRSYTPHVEAQWLARGTQVDIGKASFSWTVYADSAPPASGVVPFQSLIPPSNLLELTEGCRSIGYYRSYFDPHKSYG